MRALGPPDAGFDLLEHAMGGASRWGSRVFEDDDGADGDAVEALRVHPLLGALGEEREHGGADAHEAQDVR